MISQSPWACPRCNLTIEPDRTTPTSVCEHYPPPTSGFVNWIGDEAYLFSEERDGALAKALVSHVEMQLSVGSLAQGVLTASECMALARAAGFSEQEVSILAARTPSVQITNNIVSMLCQGRDQAPTATESFIQRSIRPTATDRVLDIGASTGRYLSLIAGSGAELIGLDIDAFSLLVARELWDRLFPLERRMFVVADALNAPLAPGSISILSSFVTLSLLPIRQTLQTFHRALSRGGTLVLTIEGPGFLKQISETLPIIDTRRIGLLRWYMGQQLLAMGIDWQQNAQTRRLAGVTTFSKTTISRFVSEAGFAVEAVEVLALHGGADRLYGVVATRQ